MYKLLSVIFSFAGLLLTSLSVFDSWSKIENSVMYDNAMRVVGEPEEMLKLPYIQEKLFKEKLYRLGVLFISISTFLQFFI